MQASNTNPVKIFLTGATGYIGGSVLTNLLRPSNAGKWQITVLTRSKDTIPKFQELGVTPLVGSLDDTDLLIKAASEADVVMQLADCDHLPATKAIVQGLSDSGSSNGKRKIYIHCSGTGALSDHSHAEYTTEKIYNDLDLESIHAIPLSNMHRDVESYIFENNQSYDSIMVSPPIVHGVGTGHFKRLTLIAPGLFHVFAAAGHAILPGKGLNVWSNVHILDLADFFELLLVKALEGKASTGKDGFYFCESGEHTLKSLVTKLAAELHKHKIIESAEPVVYKAEDIEAKFGPLGYGLTSNSRSKADRARALGWKPEGTRDDVYTSLEAEIAFIVAQKKNTQ